MKKIWLLVVVMLMLSAFVYADTVDTIGEIILKPGIEDVDVGYMKLAMMVLGYYDTQSFTNVYDAPFEEAVKGYQAAKELDVDGIFGEQSYNAVTADNGMPIIYSSVLKPENKDHDVRVLKVALRSLNYLLTPVTDDVFDSATVEAVIAFQKAQNLEADGIVGKATLSRLVELKRLLFVPEEEVATLTLTKFEKGMVHDEVMTLQGALATEGLFDANAYSPQFGDLTDAAVRAFQTKYGLVVDGVAGTGTLSKLESLGLIKLSTVAANVPVVSRGASGSRYGEYIAWKDASVLLPRMSTIVTVEDFETGKMFKVKISYGHNHADVEAASAEDAKIMLALWGGKWSWDRRAVLVYHKDRVLAASMNGMPHAGLDTAKEGVTVSGRSGGFGKGYNYDSIKGNLMDGHVCMHFKDSTLHGGGKVDSKHQAMIKKAAGIQ